MASVTVPGTGTSTISEAFNNQYNSALAQQIADALAAASNAHTLNITTTPAGVSPPAPSLPGTNQLIILGGGDYTIPAATGGISDYVVVLDTSAPVTIHGGPNASIWGGLGPITLSDPARITIAESAGDVPVTITSNRRSGRREQRQRYDHRTRQQRDDPERHRQQRAVGGRGERLHPRRHGNQHGPRRRPQRYDRCAGGNRGRDPGRQRRTVPGRSGRFLAARFRAPATPLRAAPAPGTSRQPVPPPTQSFAAHRVT